MYVLEFSTKVTSFGSVISNWNPLKGSIFETETGMVISVFDSPSPDPMYISLTANISAWIVVFCKALSGSTSFVVNVNSFETTCFESVATLIFMDVLDPELMVRGKLWSVENGASKLYEDNTKSEFPSLEIETDWVGLEPIGISPKFILVVWRLNSGPTIVIFPLMALVERPDPLTSDKTTSEIDNE